MTDASIIMSLDPRHSTGTVDDSNVRPRSFDEICSRPKGQGLQGLGEFRDPEASQETLRPDLAGDLAHSSGRSSAGTPTAAQAKAAAKALFTGGRSEGGGSCRQHTRAKSRRKGIIR